MINQKIIEKLTSEVLRRLPIDRDENSILINSYIKHYGKIKVTIEERTFYSNGINAIGGNFKVKDFKRIGII